MGKSYIIVVQINDSISGSQPTIYSISMSSRGAELDGFLQILDRSVDVNSIEVYAGLTPASLMRGQRLTRTDLGILQGVVPKLV